MHQKLYNCTKLHSDFFLAQHPHYLSLFLYLLSTFCSNSISDRLHLSGLKTFAFTLKSRSIGTDNSFSEFISDIDISCQYAIFLLPPLCAIFSTLYDRNVRADVSTTPELSLGDLSTVRISWRMSNSSIVYLAQLCALGQIYIFYTASKKRT